MTNKDDPDLPEIEATRTQMNKTLRKLQRQIAAQKREESLQLIMKASPRDQKLFHRLIREQRQKTSEPPNLTFGNKETPSASCLEEWRHYFTNLATPDTNTPHDRDYASSITNIVNLLKHLKPKEHITRHIPEVTPTTIKELIASLKLGKSVDYAGIAAEHLHYTGPTLPTVISNILNPITQDCQVPSSLKIGLITPVYKGKRSPTDPDNYRRLTVTPQL